MTTNDGGTWLKKVIGAAVVLLVVAAGARVAYEFLVPLVPILVVLVVLGVIYAVVLGGWRR